MSEGEEPRFLPPQAPGSETPPQFVAPDAAAGPAPARRLDPEPAPEPAPPAQPIAGFQPPAGAAPPRPRAEPAVIAPRAPGTPVDEGNSPAIGSFSLGIAGLLLFFLGGFGLVFVLNLPCSIAAWALSPQGVRRVEEGRTRQHLGLAKAGRILGIIGTVMGVIAIVAWALLIAFSADIRHDVGDMFDNNSGSDSPNNDSLNIDTIRLVRLVAGLISLAL